MVDDFMNCGPSIEPHLLLLRISGGVGKYICNHFVIVATCGQDRIDQASQVKRTGEGIRWQGVSDEDLIRGQRLLQAITTY
jgi:hypothetical protein